MAAWVLQANLNHARQAQDLFVHTLTERGCGLGIAAEPYQIPEHPSWVGNDLGSVAVTWRADAPASLPATLVGKGKGWVAVRWGPVLVVGVYLPPSQDLSGFAERLDSLSAIISGSGGSPRTDRRGVAVEEWAVTLDLRLLNERGISTCIRERRESVVDLTWASPATLNKVLEWRVATEVETLSDHMYIVYGLVVTPEQVLQRRQLRETTSPRRWSTKKMNEDAFMASILLATWLGRGEPREASKDIDQEVE
ncbi:uncharacterized protein [Anoplolepis gracilipes]|uniref:uncharacterized protein n=1 Tax=Anoplolepis gracilipes TaxID=354296 RepID=UPI003BA19102